MASRLSSFANMMLARTEEERLARLYNDPHGTEDRPNLLHAMATPQEPSEGKTRHGRWKVRKTTYMIRFGHHRFG